MSVTESQRMFRGSGFWSKRSRFQKFAVIVTIVVFIAAVIALCCVFLIKNQVPAICDDSVCRSEADKLIANLNPQADPCYDFYDFACGNYEKKHELPPDKGRLATFDAVGDNVLDRLKLMYAKPADEQRVKPLKFISEFYQTCNRSVDDVDSLRQMLGQIGGWPVAKIDNTRSELKASFESTLLVVIAEHGEPILVSINVSPNPYNTTTYAISVSYSDLIRCYD